MGGRGKQSQEVLQMHKWTGLGNVWAAVGKKLADHHWVSEEGAQAEGRPKGRSGCPHWTPGIPRKPGGPPARQLDTQLPGRLDQGHLSADCQLSGPRENRDAS